MNIDKETIQPCHPERSEESTSSCDQRASAWRSFAPLRMTWSEKPLFFCQHSSPGKRCLLLYIQHVPSSPQRYYTFSGRLSHSVEKRSTTKQLRVYLTAKNATAWKEVSLPSRKPSTSERVFDTMCDNTYQAPISLSRGVCIYGRTATTHFYCAWATTR